MLKAAYEQALDSEGAAQKELEAQLDSLDGQMKSLQNSTQEFWTTLIDSDLVTYIVKLADGFVKLGTGIQSFFNAIPGQNGGITTLTGLVAGILSLTKNFGRDKMFSLIFKCYKCAEGYECSLGY